MEVTHLLQQRQHHVPHNWSQQDNSVCPLLALQVSCVKLFNTQYVILSLTVCSTQQLGLGEDLLDLILHEGNLDSVPFPSEDRNSPDPMLELFSMPVKCSSPTHSLLYSDSQAPPLNPQAPSTDPQTPPTNPQAPSTDPHSSLTNSLDWLLLQPQLGEVDQYYLNNDQFWLNHCSPSNSSAVSSVTSPQQPDSPPADVDNVVSQPENFVQPSHELLEQYGCLHDHTYAAMDPKYSNIPEEEKYQEKRRKNNMASQLSRAKRKRKYSTMFTRLGELQEENKRLKEEVSIAELEAAKLKKLIIGKLTTTST